MNKILNYIKQSFLGRTVSYLIRNPFLIVVIILLGVVGHDKGVQWYDEYMVLYEEANNKIETNHQKYPIEYSKDNAIKYNRRDE